MAVCINCHILLRSNQQLHEYLAVDLNPDLVSIAEEWCGREISEEDRLCQECVSLLVREASNRDELPHNRPNRQSGHVCVCISCGLSLGRRSGRRRHRLHEGSIVRSYIENHIFPRQVTDEAWACHRCWMQGYSNRNEELPMDILMGNPQQAVADAVTAAENEPGPVMTEEPSDPSSRSVTVPGSESDSWTGPPLNIRPSGPLEVRLNNYSRTPETSTHCFVPDCQNTERLRVPLYLKRAILSKYKLYITPNSRVCQDHISLFNWEILNEYEFTSTFTENQIEAMLDLLASVSTTCVLNFENIQNVNDSLCHYWTGLNVVNFMSLFNSVPQLGGITKKAKTALGMYLVKLRTGEPITRLASLFLKSTGTVCIYLKKVRNCLTEFYVPLHLGINHMSRVGHSARNLIIPQGLFGSEEDNNVIVICDGTYVYLQKSSNYLFQKKSYSPHKYRNLVKPFLMVACDGHIIDAYGPYAADQSDADIVKNLFQNIDSPLRSYFRQGDVFILDRGFRDSIDLLTTLGYSIHKPESLSLGETQLSTIKANKSRCVTLCRWVVEVVNGRFKRDFKIFRNTYFNVAARNLMPDFRIAAAILNNFHPVITDHPDAQSILDRALERLEMPNVLADYVIGHRLNWHRSNFTNIDAQLPQLNVFPVMEMRDLILFALGIYQIKQARSYYGEHIRQNGSFQVEVDANLQQHGRDQILIRGRIRSRFQSNKIYKTYILLNPNAAGWNQSIEGYYCTCIIGKRTVGSCAHVMTIVWYLGWARHQDTPVMPPASFLDGILVRDDVENEEIE